MRIVAIAAGDAMAVHTALPERTVLIYLTLNLSVREIQRIVENGRSMGVGEQQPGLIPVSQYRAPGMAMCAHLDFGVRGAGRATMRKAGNGIYDPGNRGGVSHLDEQAIVTAGSAPLTARHGPSPLHV
jgi:hypothetical protein